MLATWIFLALSLVGLALAANTLWPSSRWQVLAPSFFAGWLTGELAGPVLVVEVIGTAVLVALGALDHALGWVALAITVVSAVGLVRILVVSAGSAAVIETALREGLGDDYRDEIAPGRAERLAKRSSRAQLFVPFYLRDRRVKRVRNIRYAEGAGKRRLLDVYAPKAPAATTGRGAPVLLQIHGGGWVIGDKSQQGLPLMLHLAAEGWVCVANNYRLSPKATFPDHLVDCKLALAWIREHIAEYGGDPDFVVVTGGSAGGHLAALVALTANDPALQPGFEDTDTSVAACVPFYGVYDLLGLLDVEKKTPVDRWLVNAVMKTTIAEDPRPFELGSPTRRTRADAPPFFVLHGDADNIAPVDQARGFVASLRAVSTAPVLYAELPGCSHAFDVFHSVRTGNAVNGVDRFLAWVYSAYSAALAEQGRAPADPEADGGPTDTPDERHALTGDASAGAARGGT